MIHLSDHELQQVKGILRRYPEVNSAHIFGSRVLGTHAKGSDIDIALTGKLTASTLTAIRNDFEESLLPYFVDVLDVKTISNIELLEHIKRYGQDLFSGTKKQ